MNWIVQAALAAALGELMLGKRLGKRAMWWGALIGLLPELEVIASAFLDQARAVAFRHGPFHSLLVVALLSVAAAYGLEISWKPFASIRRAQAMGFAFAIGCAHLLLDCFTVDGAALLWPFSSHRLSFNLLHPEDPLFTAPLLVTVLWMAFLKADLIKKSRSKKKQAPSKRLRICLWGIGLSGAYTALAIAFKLTLSAGFDADLARRGIIYERRTEAPVSREILLWRSVVEFDGEFWVGYRSLFEWFSTPVRWTVYSKNREALAKVSKLPEFNILTASTDGWWIARPTAKGAWLGDIRRGEFRTWGAKKSVVDSALTHAFNLDISASGDPVQALSEPTGSRTEFVKRMAARIFGDHDAWEANPRLDGVTGSLPEYLPVKP